MKAETWKRIEAVMENGDPLKDVTDAEELAEYCVTLREAIQKHLPALREMAAQIISPKDNIFAEIVRDLEACL